MKRELIALTAALTLAAALTGCSSNDKDVNGGTGGSSGAQTGQTAAGRRTSASRGRLDRYVEDGTYSADPNGQVAGGRSAVRDFTQGARDMMRDAGDAAADLGRDVGRAAHEIPGTPSWEPDSSARY